MKSRICLIVSAIILILSSLGCSSQQPLSFEIGHDEFIKDKHFTWATNVDIGETIVITLASNPTTGFTWPDIAQISNQDIVEQTDHNFLSPDQMAATGTSGKDVWKFKTIGKGTTTIRMDYNQPWDGGEKSEWSLVATITVE